MNKIIRDCKHLRSMLVESSQFSEYYTSEEATIYEELWKLCEYVKVFDEKQVAIVWHINDIKSFRPDLTDEECKQVLEQYQCFDKTSEFEILEAIADEMFPKGED